MANNKDKKNHNKNHNKPHLQKPNEEQIKKIMMGCAEIDEAIDNFHEDMKDAERMSRLMLTIVKQAKLSTGVLVAATPAVPVKDADGKPQLRVKLNLLQGEDGKFFAAAFTSQEEMKGAQELGNGSPIMLMPLEQLLGVCSVYPDLEGLMLNPFGTRRVFLSTAAIKLMNEEAKKREELKQNAAKVQGPGAAEIEKTMAGCAEIDKAIDSYYADKGQRERMLDLMLTIMKEAKKNTGVLVAAMPESPEGKTEDGQLMRRFKLNTLKGEDGKLFAAAFTSPAEVARSQQKGINSPIMLMPLGQLLDIVSKRTDIEGCLLNAFGDKRVFLSIPAVKAMLEDMKKVDVSDPAVAEKIKQQTRDAVARAKAQADGAPAPGQAAGTPDPAKMKELIEKRARERAGKIAVSGVLGAVIGDVLGTPVEFMGREELAADPVTDMREGGVHGKPMGFWSDDSSMLLAAVSQLSSTENLNYDAVMDEYLSWKLYGKYTPDEGEAFGIGRTCETAIMTFAANKPALSCGLTGEHDCGNGSLMRILPFALLLMRKGHVFDETDRYMIHLASSMTHAHPRAKLACEIYSLSLRTAFLSLGMKDKVSLLQESINDLDLFYRGPIALADEAEETEEEKQMDEEAMENHREFVKDYDEIRAEIPVFGRLWNMAELAKLPESEIKSSGYVVDTLEAALWCFMNTSSYEECVLKAVNLGGDTDTVASVAGGIAGIYYGTEGIPAKWLEKLPRRQWIEETAAGFQTKWLG